MRVRIIQPTVELPKKKKVCAYARVSTGSELQGESLENQITYYENLIRSNPDYEFVEVLQIGELQELQTTDQSFNE